MMNALKQFQEFGLNKTMRPAALLTDVTDLHALGLPATQALLFVAAFDWDQNDETRAFAGRFPKVSWGDADDVPGQRVWGGDALPEGD
jgi:hypothetical protein